ncbi:MAG TPA: cell division protein FtsL [Hyphomicrobium sp.]|nr:cell division protein FtsL [Hyphomicrobium sp.]
MRLLNIAAFFFAVASAFLLYSLNYETRRLEAHIQAQERAAQKAKSDIAVLKAERSHLSRPARIDPIARSQGLAPPRADQLVAPDVAAAIGKQNPVALRRIAESQ